MLPLQTASVVLNILTASVVGIEIVVLRVMHHIDHIKPKLTVIYASSAQQAPRDGQMLLLCSDSVPVMLLSVLK